MTEFELSPSEEAKYDHLTEAQNLTPYEARQIIEMERYAAIGKKVTHEAQQPTKQPAPRHNSRRGGRAFPEPSDSELDLDWNGTSELPNPAVIEEGQEAFDAFAHGAEEAAIKSLAKRAGISEAHAAVRLKASKRN